MTKYDRVGDDLDTNTLEMARYKLRAKLMISAQDETKEPKEPRYRQITHVWPVWPPLYRKDDGLRDFGMDGRRW